MRQPIYLNRFQLPYHSVENGPQYSTLQYQRRVRVLPSAASLIRTTDDIDLFEHTDVWYISL